MALADEIKEYEPTSTFLRRHEFVTFHQSYSYEDFVEGIKPRECHDRLKLTGMLWEPKKHMMSNDLPREKLPMADLQHHTPDDLLQTAEQLFESGHPEMYRAAVLESIRARS